jgi:hypothetical protein
VRRVREDFGVEVRIDLAPLRAGADGLARQPMVAGDIFYPNGDIGVLLYFKPTIIGTEPPDIAQYRARNRTFPHESSSDQFYDEAQWESYRSLGYFAAREAFRQIDVRAVQPVSDRVADAFARARRDWFSVPEDLAERASRVAQVVAELDGDLFAAGNDLLLRQVYPESAAATGNPERPGEIPARDELLSSLALVREAIVAFEGLFLSERLARRFNEPIYLGLTNYMARWATAPLFRFWWPVLAGACTDAFRRFVTGQLGASEDEAWEVVSGAPPADAIDLTRLRAADDADARGATHFVLTVRYHAGDAATVPRLRVVVARARPRPLGTDAVWWPSDELVVPIGLWGMGIGTRFLRALLARFDDSVHRAYVLVPPPTDATYAARKAVADVAQLYLHSGFETASAAEASELGQHPDVRRELDELHARRMALAGGSSESPSPDNNGSDELAPAPTWLVRREGTAQAL